MLLLLHLLHLLEHEGSSVRWRSRASWSGGNHRAPRLLLVLLLTSSSVNVEATPTLYVMEGSDFLSEQAWDQCAEPASPSVEELASLMKVH